MQRMQQVLQTQEVQTNMLWEEDSTVQYTNSRGGFLENTKNPS